MKPLKVVRVIARLNVGGPARHVRLLSRGAGDLSTILVTGNVGAGEVELAARADEADIRTIRIPSLGRAVRPLDDLRAFVELFRLLKREQPSVVHTHTAKAGLIGRVAAFLCQTPIRVHTYHGHVFSGYFGPMHTRAILFIERVLARMTTKIIAISKEQKDDLVSTYRICHADKVMVMRLGLDLEYLNQGDAEEDRQALRASLGLSDEIVIANVGRIVPVKNHDLLIEAFKRIKRDDVVLLMVGGGSEEERLRRAVQSAGLEKRIRFLGWRDDLGRIYAASDIVALTSSNEGTPVSLIEALAVGCPVVATDVGGVRDVLLNGKLGKLVPADDSAAFADALEQAIADLPRLREEAIRHRSEVRERYSADRLRTDMTELYTKLVQMNAPEHSAPGVAKR